MMMLITFIHKFCFDKGAHDIYLSFQYL